MDRDSLFDMYGMMAILLGGAALAYVVLTAFGHPEVVQGLRTVSPWLGEHAKGLSWLCAAAIFLTAMAFPPILMRRDNEDGDASLTAIGMTAWAACLLYVLAWLAYVIFK